MDLDIPKCELEAWLEELKPYQRNTILQLLATSSPEEAAEKWISATGFSDIVPFAGTIDGKSFWEKFKVEFRKFVCDENEYVEEKKALKGQRTRGALLSAASAALGASLGYSATVLVPAIALLLFTVGKIGIIAYCRDD